MICSWMWEKREPVSDFFGDDNRSKSICYFWRNCNAMHLHGGFGFHPGVLWPQKGHSFKYLRRWSCHGNVHLASSLPSSHQPLLVEGYASKQILTFWNSSRSIWVTDSEECCRCIWVIRRHLMGVISLWKFKIGDLLDKFIRYKS